MLPRRTITDAAEKGGVHQDAISSRLSRAQDHSSPARVAIVSVANDLHALAVADLVRQRETDCVLVECNRVSSSSPLSWSSDPGSSFLTTSAGPVAVSAIDVVWWRRVNAPQLLDADADAVHKDLVNNDSRSSLRGTLLTDFTGTWVCLKKLSYFIFGSKLDGVLGRRAKCDGGHSYSGLGLFFRRGLNLGLGLRSRLGLPSLLAF